MAAPKKKNLDLALALLEDHFRGVGHVGRGRLHFSKLLQKQLRVRELLLEVGLSSEILLVCNLLLKRIDLRHSSHLVRFERLALEYVERQDRRAHVFVGNDLNIGRKDLVSIRMIVVKVRVDHIADRLVRDEFQVFKEFSGGGRRGAVIHKHHVVVIDDEKRTEKRVGDELRREYDLSKLKGGVRGKYVARYKAGTNLVLLSPDVAEYFPDARSVNRALRSLIRVDKKPLRQGH